MSTAIVWFRRDLRIHDHPALTRALKEHDHVVPLFILDDVFLKGSHASANRNRFLLESLQDLKTSFKKIGGDLVIRHGIPTTELPKLIQEVSATAVYVSEDYGPAARKRDHSISVLLEKDDVGLTACPGILLVDSVTTLKTKSDTIYKVFTPFWRNWQQVERRRVLDAPSSISLPSRVTLGTIPSIEDLGTKDLSPEVSHGGETEGRKRLHAYLDTDVQVYATDHDDMGSDKTSRLSPYFHFGCISPREAESMLPSGSGPEAWHRQLAWRDFYHYILYHFPKNASQTFQEKYRALKWHDDAALLTSWKEGMTGFPVIDAAMRQLKQEGWMHNRARLIVGSFLSKDLWLNWQDGEKYFMHMLLDGDEANNNGNWQWIASVGVDPAPVFRRLYNPASQQERNDPNGSYVRRYVPELSHVDGKFLSEPWKMSQAQQEEAHCIIGKDYPAPIVDHAQARTYALEQFRSV